MSDVMGSKRVLGYRKISTGILLSIFVIIGCSSAFAIEVIKIGGTGSALGTMKLLSEAFEKSNPNIHVEIFPSIGSSGAIKAISKGLLDIGLTARPLRENEKPSGLKAFEYAKTPFVFVTKSDSQISGVNDSALVKFLTFEIQEYPDGRRVRLILRPATETDIHIIKSISSEVSRAVDMALSRPGTVIAQTDQENADIIENTAGALGFSTSTQIISEKRQLKVLFYNNVAPSTKTLADGSYPLFKSLYMITRPEMSQKIRKFIYFVQSPAGKKILEAMGNVTVRLLP